MSAGRLAAVAVLAAALMRRSAHAGATASDVNDANDFLSANVNVEVHDMLVTSHYGRLHGVANMALLEARVPYHIAGVTQLAQATLPIVTSAEGRQGRTSGLGDIDLSNVTVFELDTLKLGIGPELTFPSATDDRLGNGKWQAGAIGAVVDTEPWGLLAAMITYQHSFANDGHRRPTQNELDMQPFVTWNLPDAFYLRSTATWTFDLQDGSFAIPFGLGAGKVWKLPNDATLNVFVEPQYTAAYEGDQPQWQLFAGVELQLSN